MVDDTGRISGEARRLFKALKEAGVKTLRVEDPDRLARFLTSVRPADSWGPEATLASISEIASVCERCGLSKGRTQVVFGSGPDRARLMFIGEAPGFEEDRRGEPFVGRAGELLTRMIRAMGFRREEVYIANCVKCRPPGNRDPQPEELKSCRPYLEAQIERVDPQVICCLGRVASQALLGRGEPISRLRGRFFSHGKRQVMCTFHPAYLLRNESEKRKAWEDLKQVRDLLLKQQS